MFTHEVQVRVRYAETDQMKYVYYGNYAIYYEVARVETFRYLGYPYKNLEAEGIMMPVLELHCKYIQPALYDDLLTIKVIIPEIPAAKIVFQYEVYNQAQTLLNTGETTLVFVDMQTNRIKRCPEALKNLFKPYFEV
ncbi:MAG: acyl-CoA thioesterase [Microscillaceae bacterium]|nr:acyl-CoA thioesterase [Microscillaceae bacterium]MDW8461790.1 thioesterase family protein [Cytophagales bacterium]